MQFASAVSLSLPAKNEREGTRARRRTWQAPGMLLPPGQLHSRSVIKGPNVLPTLKELPHKRIPGRGHDPQSLQPMTHDLDLLGARASSHHTRLPITNLAVAAVRTSVLGVLNLLRMGHGCCVSQPVSSCSNLLATGETLLHASHGTARCALLHRACRV